MSVFTKENIEKEFLKYQTIFQRIENSDKETKLEIKNNQANISASFFEKKLRFSKKGLETLSERARSFIRDREEIKAEFTQLKREIQAEPEDKKIILNKLKAVETIFKQVEWVKTPEDLQYKGREKDFLLKLVIAHEMSHLYFKNQYQPQLYSNKINQIRLISENESMTKNSYTIGQMRDEIRADVLAVKLLLQEYGEDKDFQSALKKFNATRLLSSIDSFFFNLTQYNMFFVANNDFEFVKKLPELNADNLLTIEREIEKVVLKNVRVFGIELEAKDFYQEVERVKWLEEKIKEKKEFNDQFCEKAYFFERKIMDQHFKDPQECKDTISFKSLKIKGKEDGSQTFFDNKDKQVIEKFPLTYAGVMENIQRENKAYQDVQQAQKELIQQMPKLKP